MSRTPKKLKTAVAKRADFICEYCKIPESYSFFSFEVDHIVSLKHQGKTTMDNLAYSCFPCNNNKGSDIGSVLLPDRTFIRLFDPRNDSWEEHFYMESGEIIPKTKIAEVTVKLLKLNAVERIIERQLIEH